ncbi:MAG TPA: FAD-binding oxidoreductase, partial [Tepidisphaeraceae bacterium]
MEQTFRKFVIERVVAESDSIKSFYLVPADGAQLVPYKAGQYLPVKVAAPDCGKSWVRLYTISDYAPSARHYRLSVKREAGGACSAFLHDHAVAGTTLAVASPTGSFCVQGSAAGPVVLIAGGVGVTPILAMAKAILQGDCRFDIHTFYGVRDGAAHAFKDELAHLSHKHSAFHLCTAYSRPRVAHDRVGVDFDHEGRVNIELVRERLGAAFAQAIYYVCGPSAMIAQITAGLNAAGVSIDRIHTESFLPGIALSAAATAVELP